MQLNKNKIISFLCAFAPLRDNICATIHRYNLSIFSKSPVFQKSKKTRNEPNFKKTTVTATTCERETYNDSHPRTKGKTNPITNPIRTQTNPISQPFHSHLSTVLLSRAKGPTLSSQRDIPNLSDACTSKIVQKQPLYGYYPNYYKYSTYRLSTRMIMTILIPLRKMRSSTVGDALIN